MLALLVAMAAMSLAISVWSHEAGDLPGPDPGQRVYDGAGLSLTAQQVADLGQQIADLEE